MKPVEEFRYLVLAVQREGNKVLASRLRPLGITPSQSEVIRVLSERSPLTVAELGQLLICETGGSPSRLVDRLVETGVVERSPGPDRRSLHLSLTSAGRGLAAQVARAEEDLYAAIEPLLAGQAVDAALETLRAVASAFPAGGALERRITLSDGVGAEGSREATQPNAGRR